MTTALLFLSAIMAVVVWWLVRPTLNVSPWIERSTIQAAGGNGEFAMPPVQVGLWVFLAVATSLFALLISAYHMRMMEADWTKLSLPRILWLNTSVLVLASVAMEWTRASARRGQMDAMKNGLLAAGGFTFAFLAGQLWAWQQLNASGAFTLAHRRYGDLIHPAAHGVARNPLVGRPVGVGQGDRQGLARRRGGEGPPQRGALRGVLAFSAARLGSAVRGLAEY